MNDLQRVIQEIVRFLHSKDQTNTDERKALGSEYVRFCTEFNTKAEECRSMIDRRMFIEASQFADSQIPSLKKQAELLNFSEKDTFLELFKMYGWKQPPDLRTDVLKILKESLGQMSDITPLLNAYREIARSNDDGAKISLLRSIIKIDKKGEWLETLRTLEANYINTLTLEAKNAILEKNIPYLTDISEALNSDEWLVRPDELVVKKIAAVLEDAHLDELDRQAAEILERINNAYSGFDYTRLKQGLEKWHALIGKEGYNPDEAVLMQVNEAETWFNEQKKIVEDNARFERLLSELKDGLDREAPAKELEAIYRSAMLLEREIPENLRNHFAAYQESASIMARRKRILQLAVISAVSIVVVASIVLFSYSHIMKKTENVWKDRLSEALANEPADISLKMLDELTKTSPTIRIKQSIMDIESKVLLKKEQEEEKRKAFGLLAQKIKTHFKDYEKNQQQLLVDRVQLVKLIVDQKEQNVYEELEREYTSQKNTYIQKQDLKYIAFVNSIRALRKDFFVALSAGKFDKAVEAVDKADQVKEQAGLLRDVSGQTKAKQLVHFEGIEDLRGKLKNAIASKEQKETLLQKIMQPLSIADLKESLEKSISEYPTAPESAVYQEILNRQMPYAENMGLMSPEKTDPKSFYHVDFTRYQKLLAQRKKMLDESKKVFEGLENDYKKTPTYSVVLASKDGKLLYDFYLTEKEKIKTSTLGDSSIFNFTGMIDEQERYTEFELEKKKNRYSVTIKAEGQIIENLQLLYPSNISRNKELAPHICMVQKIVQDIRACKEENVEFFLVAALQNCFREKAINPYLKLGFAQIILNQLQANYPEDKTYGDALKEIQALFTKLPAKFNWMRSYDKDAATQLMLRDEVVQCENKKFHPSLSFTLELLKNSLSRQVKPVGYVIRENKTDRFVHFGHLPYKSELWIFDPQKSKMQVVGSFEGTLLKMNASFRPLPYPGFVLVYSPMDGKMTETLEKSLQEKAAAGKINFKWPDSWPIYEGVEK